MTINQLLQLSGLKLTGGQRSRLGLKIKQRAYDKKVRYKKVEEVQIVADYPEEFVPEMQEEILNYLERKKQEA